MCGDYMKVQKLYRYDTYDLIFEADCESIRKCVELAVWKNIDLSYVDLSHQDLSDINLDDATIRKANFRGTDLRGANMSEGDFSGSDFSNSILHGACLNESVMRHAAFVGARFGDTDCAGTIFEKSCFGGLSTFALKLAEAKSLKRASYIDEDGRAYQMSQPPLVISGTPKMTVLLDTHFLCGAEIMPHEKLLVGSCGAECSQAESCPPDYGHLILALAFENGRFQKNQRRQIQM